MEITRRDTLFGLGAISCGLNASLGHVARAGSALSGERPGDDFYLYANAADVAKMTIPSGHWDYGQFDVVGKDVTRRITDLVER